MKDIGVGGVLQREWHANCLLRKRFGICGYGHSILDKSTRHLYYIAFKRRGLVKEM